MALQDITITGSIRSFATTSYGQRTYIPSSDNESFPIETVTGSYAGAWPDFVDGTDYTTKLYVNVTQSWSGANVTPLGSISFIHNTMEEFVNGEFSGSIVDTVGDSLNDPLCTQYLQVNPYTIPDYYVTPFENTYTNGVLTQDTLPGFMFSVNAPPQGQMYIHYKNYYYNLPFPISINFNICQVDYVKISNFDNNGTDISLQLRSVTRISYTDPSAGRIVLNVVGIAAYPTYILYTVTSNIFTTIPSGQYNSPVVSPYNLNVNNSSTITINPFLNSILTNYTINQDTANAFNTSTGIYTFPAPNNASITVTISANFTMNPVLAGIPGAYQNAYFGLYNVTNPSRAYLVVGGLIQVTTNTFSFNATVPPLTFGANQQYALYIQDYSGFSFNVGNGVITFSDSNTNFSIGNSPLDINFEPFVDEIFSYSDCDVLMNNTSRNDISRKVQKVLYDGPSGSLVPSNIAKLITETAEPAEVNDYLFSANANVLPRYVGVRSESPDFNLNTTFGGYGSLPNVEKLQTYFASFDFFRSTTGELLDKSAAHITYLIDKDGTVFTPALSSSYYWNLIDNFETDKKANIIIYNENGDKITLGNKRIIRPGALPRAILESQIGSDPRIVNNISFGATSNTNSTSGENYDYNFIAKFGVFRAAYQKISFPPGFAAVPDDQVLTLALKTTDNENVTIEDNAIKFLKGNSNYSVTLKAKILANRVDSNNNLTSGPFSIHLTFQSSDDGSSWTTLQEEDIFYANGANIDYGYSTSATSGVFPETLPFRPVKDRLYRIVLSNGSGYTINICGDDFNVRYTQVEVLQQTGAGANNVLNYNSKYIGNTNYRYPASATPNLIVPVTVLDGAPNIHVDPLNPSEIVVDSTSNVVGLNFTIRTKSKKTTNLGTTGNATSIIRLQKSTPTTGFVNMTSNPVSYTLGDYIGSWQNNSYTFTVNDVAVAGNRYRILFDSLTEGIEIDASSYIQVTQNAVAALPPPVIIPSNSGTSSIYWTTGSSGDIVLSSSYFYPYWVNNQGIYTQNNISEIYAPNLPFTIQSYTDIIRFEGDETQVYTIVSASVDDQFIPGPPPTGLPTTGSIFLYLDKPIAPGTNINSFLIKRFHPNPNYVVMDSPVISGSGYIIPEYVTNDIKQNFDNIIVKLKESGLF